MLKSSHICNNVKQIESVIMSQDLLFKSDILILAWCIKNQINIYLTKIKTSVQT
jgi:hypothetical protein